MGNLRKIIVMMIVTELILGLGRVQMQSPYVCSNASGNYTSNSTYGADLRALLTSLPSNMSPQGHTSSVHRSPYASALCRADQTPDQCRTCVEAASREILRVCPNQKRAVLWYQYENFFCTLYYSVSSNYAISSNDGKIVMNTASESTVYFKEDVIILLVDLRVKASAGGSALKVGAARRNVSGSGSGSGSGSSTVIYGLVQCNPDLSLEECKDCLEYSFDVRSQISETTRGIRVLYPACTTQYELNPFYNDSRLIQLGILPPSPSPSPSPPPGGNASDKEEDKSRAKLVLSITLPSAVCLLLLASALLLLRKRMKQRMKETIHTADDISSLESLQYEFDKIRGATNDFGEANKLGQGGFGAVYWGKLEDGQEIAVKRLSTNSGQGDMEFKNEVVLVAKLQHRNLVRLLGFSLQGSERLLVYEFVQNASLDKFIFDPIKRSHLDWETRCKIIRGVARGILYLHEDSRLRIIHRDLKASNVLLDGDMNPKIADFGMARLFRQDETQGSTNRIVGTYGYMSPEYAMHGQFSIKSDVFSFGVLILEIISGRRNNVVHHGDNVEDLLTLTWEKWEEGTSGDMIDPVLKNSMDEVLRCMHIGLLCVQENAANRPTMTRVVGMLNSSSESFPPPLQPAFYVASRYGPAELPTSVEYDSKSSLLEKDSTTSQNNMTVTELHPR